MKFNAFDEYFKVICALAVLVLHETPYILCDEEPSYAIQLTSVDFNSKLATDNYFVMFYAPWCSFCVKLKPTWEELAEMLNAHEPGSRVKIAKVDCTIEKGICKQQQITGYPTLLYFKQDNPEPVKYSGTRDLSALANFLNDQLGTNVVEEGSDVLRPPGPVELTDENYEEHLATGKHFVKFYAPWCGHCQNLAPTWENIGVIYAPYSMTISKVDCTIQKEACKAYAIKSYPTLLWIENGVKIEKYQGVRSVEDLQTYIEERLAIVEAPAPELEKTEDAPAVTSLTGETFKDGIQKGTTFIMYFVPWCGHCKGLAPTWQDLGKKFQSTGDVTIADVDCTMEENKQLCDEQEVEGFPTLVLYKNGERIDRYTGARGLSDLISFVGKHLRLSDIVLDHDEL